MGLRKLEQDRALQASLRLEVYVLEMGVGIGEATGCQCSFESVRLASETLSVYQHPESLFEGQRRVLRVGHLFL
jgi:hypothetical protein